MQTTTFPCPLCGRRMGVGSDLVGRPVRCPHCRQVVIAPAAAPDPAAAAVQPAAPPRPAQDYAPPDFSRHAGETDDSIFADPGQQDDSLFESRVIAVELPDDPEPHLQATEQVLRRPEHTADLSPQPVLPVSGMWTQTQTKLPPLPIPLPPLSPALPDPDPDATSEERVDPFVATPAMYGQRPSEVSSPWAKLDDVIPGQPKPVVVLAPLPIDKPPPEPPPVTPAAARRLRYALIGVAAYAGVMTLVAGWAVLRGGDRGHPLNYIPDLFGQYRRASREKVADLKIDDRVIPPQLRVKIGGTLAAGDIKIEPLGVEERKVTQIATFTPAAAEPTRRPLKTPALVLKLKITNTSADVWLNPTDPAFNRKDLDPALPPFTGIETADGRRFMGGPVVWPFGPGTKRIYIEGQEGDDDPLGPGQAREYLIVSADKPDLLDAVRAGGKPHLWHVHVRRGLTRYRFEDVSVGAVVGVEFAANQVARPGA